MGGPGWFAKQASTVGDDVRPARRANCAPWRFTCGASHLDLNEWQAIVSHLRSHDSEFKFGTPRLVGVLGRAESDLEL
jgi:hypothetical protein